MSLQISVFPAWKGHPVYFYLQLFLAIHTNLGMLWILVQNPPVNDLIKNGAVQHKLAENVYNCQKVKSPNIPKYFGS